jgi:hypothetical protein
MRGRHEGLIPPDPTRSDPAALRFEHLNAEAYDIVEDPDRAIGLLILRLLQRRPEDAAARVAADELTLGAWGSIERQAWTELGARASTTRVAAWMALRMCLGDED